MFAGIGGFRSGLSHYGDFFVPVGYCEIDPYAKRAYYTELHSLADCSHVVPDIIASTLKDITRESDNRQGRLLFKLAVELAILQNVVAANYGISKTDLERLRGICVNEVKKINGSITFDEAIRWQS